MITLRTVARRDDPGGQSFCAQAAGLDQQLERLERAVRKALLFAGWSECSSNRAAYRQPPACPPCRPKAPIAFTARGIRPSLEAFCNTLSGNPEKVFQHHSCRGPIGARPMARVGRKLREIRQHWQLSLREVEQRSRRIAEERGDSSYRVSASWLADLENDEHELTLNKLIALAEIYSISIDRLVDFLHAGNELPSILGQLSSTNKTFPDQLPDETTLLQTENATSRTSYLRGVIGKLDLTLHPMIPAGSIVHIDPGKLEVSSKKDWTDEFQRPIYFLKTKDAYFCGWCELDEDSQWLILIPHPLSSASSRRWNYRTEVEILGRVVSVVISVGRITLTS